MLHVNNDNFIILLGASDGKQDAIVEFFDTLSCEESRFANFKIAIIYSLFLEDVPKSLRLSLKLKCLRDNEGKQVNLFQNILNTEIDLNRDTDIDDCDDNKDKFSKSDVECPDNIKKVESGQYIIDYKTKFPRFGKYQLELYYQKVYAEREEEWKLAAIYPLSVKEKI